MVWVNCGNASAGSYNINLKNEIEYTSRREARAEKVPSKHCHKHDR